MKSPFQQRQSLLNCNSVIWKARRLPSPWMGHLITSGDPSDRRFHDCQCSLFFNGNGDFRTRYRITKSVSQKFLTCSSKVSSLELLWEFDAVTVRPFIDIMIPWNTTLRYVEEIHGPRPRYFKAGISID